jgi:hypothetical protein
MLSEIFSGTGAARPGPYRERIGKANRDQYHR